MQCDSILLQRLTAPKPVLTMSIAESLPSPSDRALHSTPHIAPVASGYGYLERILASDGHLVVTPHARNTVEA